MASGFLSGSIVIDHPDLTEAMNTQEYLIQSFVIVNGVGMSAISLLLTTGIPFLTLAIAIVCGFFLITFFVILFFAGCFFILVF